MEDYYERTETFYNKLGSGDIRFRDNWQFELKSEFPPLPELKGYIHSQEFYIFVPNSLGINHRTYTKEQFYKDQTNLIRFRTPEYSCRQLIDPANESSPFIIIKQLFDTEQSASTIITLQNQIKLVGNIVRSSIRNEIKNFVDMMKKKKATEDEIAKSLEVFVADVRDFRSDFFALQQAYFDKWTDHMLLRYFSYVDEFISRAINYYFIGFMETSKRYVDEDAKIAGVLKDLYKLVVEEKKYRKNTFGEIRDVGEDQAKDEFVLYRNGLLNKFVIDGLRLVTNRFSVSKRLHNFVGALAAGFAMLIYLLLFIWQGEVFVYNSAPFVIITVVLYILKDRLKEGIKTISYHKAFKFFPDYTTEIRTTDKKLVLGKLKEYFAFLREKDLPEDIVRTRNKELQTMLEMFKRPERVIYYKKSMNINKKHTVQQFENYYGLNIIFRLNINQFVIRASNPYHRYVTVDLDSDDFKKMKLPKVYHINIIMKTVYIIKGGEEKVVLKKFRLIIDKRGIKRVEHIR